MSLMNNFSFLITFVLFLVMIGLIWYHFNERINDQNTKISQMVRVLTTMTAEVSLIRKKVGLPFPETIELNEEQPTPIPTSTNKLYVSDEDDDSNSDDSDSDSDSESDSDSDSEDDKEEISKQIDVIEDVVEEVVVELVEDVVKDVVEDVVEKLVKEVVEELVEEPVFSVISLEDIDVEEEKEEKEDNEEKEDVKEEYKKMSLNKLKAIVLEKKLTTDVAKLKKNDLLSILGVDV